MTSDLILLQKLKHSMKYSKHRDECKAQALYLKKQEKWELSILFFYKTKITDLSSLSCFSFYSVPNSGLYFILMSPVPTSITKQPQDHTNIFLSIFSNLSTIKIIHSRPKAPTCFPSPSTFSTHIQFASVIWCSSSYHLTMCF